MGGPHPRHWTEGSAETGPAQHCSIVEVPCPSKRCRCFVSNSSILWIMCDLFGCTLPVVTSGNEVLQSKCLCIVTNIPWNSFNAGLGRTEPYRMGSISGCFAATELSAL